MVPDVGRRDAARVLVEHEATLAMAVSRASTLVLHRDEAEGYYLNVSSRARRASSCCGAWTRRARRSGCR